MEFVTFWGVQDFGVAMLLSCLLMACSGWLSFAMDMTIAGAVYRSWTMCSLTLEAMVRPRTGSVALLVRVRTTAAGAPHN